MNICVSGSKGKMGSRICDLAKEDSELSLTGEFDVDGNAEESIKSCDCLIEFTDPKATLEHLAVCLQLNKSIVIGTTGFSEAELETIRAASEKVAVLLSPNMSIGVNILFKLVEDAAKALTADYTVEILEAHHAHKKDAPSGTAKELARIIKDKKGKINIPIESVREDEIVGEHTVTFESPFDTLELTHSAKTRDIFAKGALTAAKFLASKKSGLYSMKDALGL